MGYHNCAPVGGICKNTPGHHICDGCLDGYTGNGIFCDDIDECVTGGEGDIYCTERLRACTNTIGAFECGACLGVENADGECTDFDECMNGVHNCTIPGGFCENKPGTFDCPHCIEGFAGPDGHDCTDIDECEFDTHDCNVAVLCKNTVGGYLPSYIFKLKISL